MKVMHIADLHLGCRQYGMAQREEDFYSALAEIKEIVRDKEVNVVVVSGDVFDTSKPPPRAVYELSKFAADISKFPLGPTVVGIEGNHDRTTGNYWLKVCGIDPLDPSDKTGEAAMGIVSVRNFGVERMRIVGLNFDRSEDILAKLEGLADKGEKADVAVLHLGLAEMNAGFNPDLSVQQLLPRLKALGVKYCALGHIHIHAEQLHDDVWFVQPGSLEMKSVDEPQQKGVEIFEFRDGEIKSMEWVPYKTRQVEFLDIKTADDLNLTSAAAERLAGRLVVAYVVNTVESGASRVSEWAKEHGLMCRVVPVGGDERERREYDRANSMNLLKEAVEAFFDEGTEQHSLVMNILHTGNPRMVMEKYMNDDCGKEAEHGAQA